MGRPERQTIQQIPHNGRSWQRFDRNGQKIKVPAGQGKFQLLSRLQGANFHKLLAAEKPPQQLKRFFSSANKEVKRRNEEMPNGQIENSIKPKLPSTVYA